MMEKALMIIMFMYCSSFGLLTAQYIIGDVVGEELRSPDGTAILPDIRGLIDIDTVNNITYNITTGTYTPVDQGNDTAFYDRVETFSTAAASIAWLMVQLFSGTYIFNILALFGIPSILITCFVILYVFLLARAILAYIRGV